MQGMHRRRGRKPAYSARSRAVASAAVLLILPSLWIATAVTSVLPVAVPDTARTTGPPAQRQPPGPAPVEFSLAELDDPPPATPEPTLEAAKVSGVSLPILTYHWIRINPVPADQLGFHLSVTPAHFAEQMAFLHYAGVHPITFDQAMSAIQTGQPLPPRPVILTFDDGYGDFATQATPILQRYGFVGIDYVVSGFIGRPAYMTADQVQEVERAGMVIGCHTVSHVDLSKVTPQVARMQITVSHQQLEQLLGHQVVDFAYPYGGWTAEVEKMVMADGFRDAVTTRGGTWLQVQARGAWPRLHVDGADSLQAFAAKALSGTPAAVVTQLLRGFRSQA
jgi:peptidoglycan/xylan/chitin deacetylase (PgdA/CDA1 family)